MSTSTEALVAAIDAPRFRHFWAPRLVSRAKANTPGTDIDAVWLCERWPGGCPHCQKSGHPFNEVRVDTALVKHPFAPSLDQIAPGGGYWRSNVRVVCTIVNFAMNEWGESYLREIVASMIATSGDRLLGAVEGVWRLQMSARIDEAALEHFPIAWNLQS